MTPRNLLVGMVLVGCLAVGMAALVLYLILSRLEDDRDAALTERLGSVSMVIDEADTALVKQAESLGRDPDVLAVVFPGAPGTHGNSPAPTALLNERTADIILVVDGKGSPLIRAPSRIALANLRLPELTGRGTFVSVIDGLPYLLGAAPVLPPDPDRERPGRPAMALVGRRLDLVAAPLVAGSPHVDIAVIDEDRLVWSTLAGLPADGWKERTQKGLKVRGVRTQDHEYILFPVSNVGRQSVWALVPRHRPPTAGIGVAPAADRGRDRGRGGTGTAGDPA